MDIKYFVTPFFLWMHIFFILLLTAVICNCFLSGVFFAAIFLSPSLHSDFFYEKNLFFHFYIFHFSKLRLNLPVNFRRRPRISKNQERAFSRYEIKLLHSF